MQKPLNPTQKADIYLQLARMHESGFSAIQAFASLALTHQPLYDRFIRVNKHLASGKSIAESGYHAGIFSSIDQHLLNAGEKSGSLESIYRSLAEYYRHKSKRDRQIKSRLYFPLLILLLALFIQKLPALVLGHLQPYDYLQQIFVSFFRVIAILFVVWNLPGWLTEGRLVILGLKKAVYFLQLNIPVIAPWVIRRQINEFLNMLGLMLQAGLPAYDALPYAAKAVKNTIIRKHIEQHQAMISQGHNIAESLVVVGDIKPSTLKLIQTGEQSGKLPETLLHFCRLEYQSIKLQELALAEWLPKLLYLMIVVWMGYSLLSGMPINFLPDDLR